MHAVNGGLAVFDHIEKVAVVALCDDLVALALVHGRKLFKEGLDVCRWDELKQSGAQQASHPVIFVVLFLGNLIDGDNEIQSILRHDNDLAVTGCNGRGFKIIAGVDQLGVLFIDRGGLVIGIYQINRAFDEPRCLGSRLTSTENYGVLRTINDFSCFARLRKACWV
jgi:hypothetical protein